MSDDLRPDPDALLAALQKSEARSGGQLKIFLGMCPGVGKTYAMLLAGQQRQEEGDDVIIGLIETHGRIETQALTAGVARVPRKRIEHRGVELEEMDLDAILERKPGLVLVDELAHTNAPSSRHLKRYQDVIELLDAGIDVYTTLNVQHVESHRDIITQITGAPVHETVPDSVLDRADEIELIDISPAELRKRLEEGKVYLGDRAIAASENFFREGNLKALREIALRLSAERADREMREFMRSQRIAGPWRSRERLLVAVGPSPYSERLVRWTRRMATSAHSSWIAVSVDLGTQLNAEDKTRLDRNLSLARSLGAEVLLTTGTNIVDTLLRIAREQNVSQIVVGKPLSPRIVDFLQGGSLVDKLIRKSGEIDVYVVRAEKTTLPWKPNFREFSSPRFLSECGSGILGVLGVTILGLWLQPTIGYMTVGMLYLLGVLIGSTLLSRGPMLIAATLTALAWDYLFIPPHFTFSIGSLHDLMLFGMYFVVALVLGHLNTRLRQREATERRREIQTTALYRFSQELTESRTLSDALSASAARMDEFFNGATAIFLKDAEGLSRTQAAGNRTTEREFAVALWAYEHNEPAGRFTDTLAQSEALYLPLRTSDDVVGVLGIQTAHLEPAERQMLETFASQIALLIQRQTLQSQAEQAKLEERSRHLQKTLLDSVSHEFKTPLAIISTALDNLDATRPPPATLLSEIRQAVQRLSRVVGNLLDITRIETGTIQPRLEWCDLAEIIQSASQRSAPNHQVTVAVSEAVGMAKVDAGLLEEMLANLIRNAAQHSPNDAPIAIVAKPGLEIRVIDEGSGIRAEDQARVFQKFHRGVTSLPGGLGLGLSIVKGFAEAYGGSVQAESRKDGKTGAEFVLRLPVETQSTATMEVHS